MEGGWPNVAIMQGAKLDQVGKCMFRLSGEAPTDRYEHQEEGMTMVIKAQEISFSTTDNIHSTPINAKAQVVLELVRPITL